MKKFVFLLMLVISLSLIIAYQPRLVLDKSSSIENPIQISNPEISQAFYGELSGSPAYYVINENKPFNLYVRILTTDFSNQTFDARVNNIVLEGKTSNWDSFYEKFVGDNYLQGPEYKLDSAEGRYLIEVSNENNAGKYVLVVGKKEVFGFKDSIKTLLDLPSLKIKFFEKGALSIFEGSIGKFIFGVEIVFAIILLIIIGFWVRWKKNGGSWERVSKKK